MLGFIVSLLCGCMAMGIFDGKPEFFFVGFLFSYLIQRDSKLERKLKAFEEKLRKFEATPFTSSERKIPSEENAPLNAATENISPPIVITESIVPTTTQESVPQESDAWDAVFSYYKRWLGTSNPIVVVGVVILLFGFGFLIKLAVSVGYFQVPIEVKLTAIAAFGALIAGFGLRQHTARPDFARALIGGGIGIVYLTVFGAFGFYALLSPEVAFGLFVLLTGISFFASLRLQAQSLAMLGCLGGFLGPVLGSTGQGGYVSLFSFYLVLNVLIFGISFYKNWPTLNLIGFLFTFCFGVMGGSTSYVPGNFSKIEPFLLLFTVLYALIPLINQIKNKRVRSFADTVLLFGTPLASFGLQCAVTEHLRNGAGWSAGGYALFYLGLYAYSRIQNVDPIIAGIYRVIGYSFAALVIPLFLDFQWTCIAWGLLGLAMYWSGVQRKSVPENYFGVFVLIGAFLIAGVDFFDNTVGSQTQTIAWIVVLGCIYIAAALFTRRAIDEKTSTPSLFMPLTFFSLAGCLFIFLADIQAVSNYFRYANTYQFDGIFSLLVVTALGFLILGEKKNITPFTLPAQSFMFASPVLFWMDHELSESMTYEIVPWIFLFGLTVCTLRYNERRQNKVGAQLLIAWGTFASIVCYKAQQLSLAFVGNAGNWSFCARLIALSAFLLGLSFLRRKQLWPYTQNKDVHNGVIRYGLSASILVYLLASISIPGNSWPFSYIPAINPLDLTVLLACISIICAFSDVTAENSWFRFKNRSIGALIFLMLNVIAARAVHHWFGVSYELSILLDSPTFQAVLSLFWGVLAFGLLISAGRSAQRSMWILGASLFAAVVIKLFLIDLANTGTLARIISFIGVGGLMLLIGYLCPIPPQKKN